MPGHAGPPVSHVWSIDDLGRVLSRVFGAKPGLAASAPVVDVQPPGDMDRFSPARGGLIRAGLAGQPGTDPADNA